MSEISLPEDPYVELTDEEEWDLYLEHEHTKPDHDLGKPVRRGTQVSQKVVTLGIAKTRHFVAETSPRAPLSSESPIRNPYRVEGEDWEEVKLCWDSEKKDFVLPGSVSRSRGKRSGRERRFAKGPLPLEWWLACLRADPNGLNLALGILWKSKCNVCERAKEPVKVSQEFGNILGLSRYQRLRAIAGLEIAGLIEVKRAPSHAPEVRLIPWKGMTAPSRSGQ